ncbi:MAG: hypothetical protein MMC33_008389 [Icmadophila ericetorum]|nr:hypothetical protein [Icmadophila ericetorum]
MSFNGHRAHSPRLLTRTREDEDVTRLRDLIDFTHRRTAGSSSESCPLLRSNGAAAIAIRTPVTQNQPRVSNQNSSPDITNLLSDRTARARGGPVAGLRLARAQAVTRMANDPFLTEVEAADALQAATRYATDVLPEFETLVVRRSRLFSSLRYSEGLEAIGDQLPVYTPRIPDRRGSRVDILNTVEGKELRRDTPPTYQPRIPVRRGNHLGILRTPLPQATLAENRRSTTSRQSPDEIRSFVLSALSKPISTPIPLTPRLDAPARGVLRRSPSATLYMQSSENKAALVAAGHALTGSQINHLSGRRRRRDTNDLFGWTSLEQVRFSQAVAAFEVSQAHPRPPNSPQEPRRSKRQSLRDWARRFRYWGSQPDEEGEGEDGMNDHELRD